MKKILILTSMLACASQLAAMAPLNMTAAQAEARVPEQPWNAAQQAAVLQLCGEMVTQSQALVATHNPRTNRAHMALIDRFVALATTLCGQMASIDGDIMLAINADMIRLTTEYTRLENAIRQLTQNVAATGRISALAYFAHAPANNNI